MPRETVELGAQRPPPQSRHSGAIVFLVAHQDDEFMVAPIIADAKRAGRNLKIVFLTNGDGGAASPATRNRESLNFLSSISVGMTEVAFLGELLSVSDGQLFRRLGDVHDALLHILTAMEPISTIYVHAWEGGNPDHDAAYALACGLAAILHIPNPILQVPFYRAPRRGPLPFVLFAPLSENGPTAFYRVGIIDRLRRLAYIRYYPSQRRTFLVFFPLLILDALLKPGIPIQFASPARLSERPMPSMLRYEKICYISFSDMAPFIEAYWQRVCRGDGSRSMGDQPPPSSRSKPIQD